MLLSIYSSITYDPTESVGSHAFWRIVEWEMRTRSVIISSNGVGSNPGVRIQPDS